MPKKIEPKSSPRNTIANWMVIAPLKYMGLTVALVAGSLVLTRLLSLLFAKPNLIVAIVGLLTYAFAIVFPIVRMPRWTPTDPLDRRSFVALDFLTTLIPYVMIGLPWMLILAYGIPKSAISLLIATAMGASPVIGVLVIIAYLYFMGLCIQNIIATFRAGVAMGVSRARLAWSIPFGISLMWGPRFFLDDRTKPVLPIKSGWYGRLVNWIIAKPMNATLVFVLYTVIGYLVTGILVTAISLLMFLIFLMFLAVQREKFMKKIGGGFAIMGIIVNFALLAMWLIFLYSTIANYAAARHNAAPGNVQLEQVTSDR